MENKGELKIEDETGALFAGICGIELGFEEAGFKPPKWVIECNPFAQSIIKKRYPSTKIYGDVKKVDFRTIPKVQILTGGFPCQDISNAGKRAGIKGSRSSLWGYYCKAISQIQPKIAFIENVSALTQRGLDTVLCDLAKIGYDAEWYCIPASAVGANHQRDRIFIIAYPHSNGDRFNITPNNKKKTEVWDKDNQGIISEQCSKTNGSRDVSNTDTKRLQGCEKQRSIEKSRENRKQQFTRQDRGWSVEPKVGRMVNGIPNRVDRIKSLGNAVVPQVAEVFAKAIKEYEQNKPSIVRKTQQEVRKR